MLPSPAFVQSREFWFSPIDSIVCMRRFNPTDGCGTLYPWLLSITKRVETFSLLQGSHLCVVLWLHLFKILCNFDACCIFFQWLSLKGLGSVQQIGHTATVPLSLQCGLASSSVIRLSLSAQSKPIFTVWKVFQQWENLHEPEDYFLWIWMQMYCHS